MRRKKQRSRIVVPVIILIAVAVVGGGWWFWPRGDAAQAAPVHEAAPTASEAASSVTIPEAVVVADAPEDRIPDEVLTPIGSRESGSDASEPTSDPVPTPEPVTNQATGKPEEAAQPASRNPRIDASMQRYQAGQVLEARQELNGMLTITRDAAEEAELRRDLAKIADETIFSRERLPNDPLTDTYTIQPGDRLINVAKQFDVPYEVIMRINGIDDAGRIRAGQKIKVLHGPFNVKIHKSEFRLDVYLQDLYVRSFPVGLGAEQATPEGEWVVKERLRNPTYYPPASAGAKRIIPPDDPSNPLGEHWIGLEGIGGDALGRVGYGIHGTIDPDSIGKAMSLGCIRMHNDDVAFLYDLLLPGQSKVTTLP